MCWAAGEELYIFTSEKKMKTLVVCSPGGHLVAARKLMKLIPLKSFKYVVHDYHFSDVDGVPVVIFPHSDRDWRLILQLGQSLRIILIERPELIISTGASIAVSFFFWAKLLRIKSIYVETASSIKKPTLTARLVHRLATRMYVRYPELLQCLRKARYLG